MVFLRIAVLLLALLGFLALGVPLQWLARRRGWALAGAVPVFFSRMLCALLRITVHVPARQSPERPQLVVANHVSWTDILALCTREPQCFLAKREVGGWPLFGTFARLQGTVFVDRQRRRGIPAVNARMAEAMRAGGPVVLFAEATTSDGTRVKPFFSSHFAAARDLLRMDPACDSVAVQPAALVYTRRDGLPLGRAGRADIAWYGDMSLLPHMLALLRGGPLDCHVIFAPPLRYRRGDDRKDIARACRMAVRACATAALAGRAQAAEAGHRRKLPVLLDAETA